MQHMILFLGQFNRLEICETQMHLLGWEVSNKSGQDC